jgi:uncharacterized membrane protein
VLKLKKNGRITLALLLAVVLTLSLTAPVGAQTQLFTPYLGVSVTPGESLDYDIEVINTGSGIEYVTFEVTGLSDDWTYHLTADGRDINRLSVRPGESETVNLQVEVPLKIEKGEYEFRVVAKNRDGSQSVLPISVNVTEEGTYRTELTSDQPNLEGHADSNFSYDATLHNRTASEQRYSLVAEPPSGWQVRFKSGGENVTSVTVEPNAETNITIEVTPPQGVTEGTYTIPITASTSGTSAKLELEAVITGTYALKVSTPDERFNFDITAGRSKTVELVLTNEGSAELQGIELTATPPADWNVEFEPEVVDVLGPGESTRVKATVTASGNAIAGDYLLGIEAKTDEVSQTATFRATVETSLLWGWIGILVIAGVIVGIGYLFRKYGRR